MTTPIDTQRFDDAIHNLIAGLRLFAGRDEALNLTINEGEWALAAHRLTLAEQATQADMMSEMFERDTPDMGFLEKLERGEHLTTAFLKHADDAPKPAQGEGVLQVDREAAVKEACAKVADARADEYRASILGSTFGQALAAERTAIECENIAEAIRALDVAALVAPPAAAASKVGRKHIEAIALAERLRPWGEYSFAEMHQATARDLFKQAADMIEALALRPQRS